MSGTPRLVERAQTDVDEIFNWLATRTLKGAIAWYLAFLESIEKIAEAPESFSEAPEARRLHHALRQALFKTRRGRVYRIVFEVLDAEIIVLRVRGPGQAPLRLRDLPGN
jgi:plasmid stabilization system protein ParE